MLRRPLAPASFAAVSLTVAVVFALGTAPAGSAAATDMPAAPPGTRASTGAETGAPTGAKRPGARFAAGGANLSRIWWNQPRPVELLGLSEEQRKAMDALLIDLLERRRELARESLEIRRTLGDHLAAGDWKAAEKASAELGERASALVRGDTDLMLAALRLLQPEQRRTLDRELPMILRRPWLQGGAGLRSGRFPRSGPPSRQPGQ